MKYIYLFGVIVSFGLALISLLGVELGNHFIGFVALMALAGNWLAFLREELLWS